MLLLGSCSLLLGMLISYAAVYLVAVAGFWLVDVRGIQMLYMVVSGFLCGLYVPIWIFPGWLLAVARSTPFPAMMMYPVDVLSGRTDGLDAGLLVLAQVGWLAVLVVAGQLATRAGRRVLEVQGG
jgi:ABC-2 type transport system permease protein